MRTGDRQRVKHRSALPWPAFAAVVVLTGSLLSPAFGAAPVRCDIRGTAAGERLVGTAGDDSICGMGGDARLWGYRGEDKILGAEGRDRLWGGIGEDALAGGDGADRLRGGPAGDRLIGGAGRDILRGQRGPDTLLAADGTPNDIVHGGPGNDGCAIDIGDTVIGCETVVA